MSFEVRQGDCVELMAAMPAGSVDAVVCDPPYGLEFMGKEWDRLSPGSGRADLSNRDNFKPTKSEFKDGVGTKVGAPQKNPRCRKCGKLKFDHDKGKCRCEAPDWNTRQSEYAYLQQVWHERWATEALRVLKPGGHLLAFGGTRTYHRLVCAVEDAGFEVRDTISWLYGSGFPKSLDVGRAIDKANGAEPDRITENESGSLGGFGDAGWNATPRQLHYDSPKTPAAERWEGWGTALKPAHEPVVVARKPLSGTVAGNVLEHGTGALNIDGTRVGREEGDRTEYGLENGAEAGIGYHGLDGRTPYDGSGGRWPANVVLSHTEGCVQVGTRKVKSGTAVNRNRPEERSTYAASSYEIRLGPGDDATYAGPDGTETVGAWSCTPDCPVRLLDEQTGELHSQDPKTRQHPGASKFENQGAGDGWRTERGAEGWYGDTGGASRFFPTFTHDTLCVLCGLPCVESAANPSPRSEPASDIAAGDAQAPLSPEHGANSPSSDTSASTAESPSRTTPAIPENAGAGVSAQLAAAAKLARRIVPVARSVETLCDSCATATARNVVQWQLDPTRESLAGPVSTLERRQLILSRNLALIAVGMDSTGITPTTGDLSSCFGSALAATQSATPTSATADESDLELRLKYQSKASRAERNAGLEGFDKKRTHRYSEKAQGPLPQQTPSVGVVEGNVHPTVKPISLMRWLVRLVTPLGGTVLDPFAGSGTTGIASVLEAFDFIGLEREPEYVKIAEARIAWWHKHRGDGEAAEILAAGEARDEVEATGQLGMFD